MHHILLLLDHKENRRLLAEWLGHKYHVILDGEQALDEPFDLGILDGPALDRLWERVQARKEAEQPVLLPFLLVTARKDARYVTRHLWRTVDELIMTPLEKMELQTRVEALLQTRQLSLELHQRYRRLFENVPLGLYRTTPDGCFLEANAALAQMLGYPNREALMAIKSTDLYVDPQDRQRWQKLMERQGAVRHFETQLYRRDKAVIWVENNAQVVRDAEGHVLYYEGSLQDITDRKRAEEALRRERDRAQRYLDIAGVIIVALNARGEITLINRKGCEILGYERDELIGQSWFDTCLPAQIREDVKSVSQKLMAGEIEPVEYYENPILTKSGEERIIAWHNTVLTDETGNIIGTLSSGEDITESKRAEEERAHAHRLLLALSQAAQAAQRARTPEEVYRTIGEEVARLGYHIAIFTLTDDQTHLTPSYLSFEPAAIQAAEKLTGLPAKDYRFPLVPGGLYQRIIAEGKAVFIELTTEFIAEALPTSLRSLAGRLADLLGMKQSIMAPLIVGGEIHGLLAVVGESLSQADVPATDGLFGGFDGFLEDQGSGER